MPPPPPSSSSARTLTYFVIVGPHDAAVFELCLPPRDDMHLKRQFMAHSALDTIDEVLWSTGEPYLSKVDRFDDQYVVSAYVGVGPFRLLLVQDQEPTANVKAFFTDMTDLCVRYLVNPFADPSRPIVSKSFRDKATTIFRQYF